MEYTNYEIFVAPFIAGADVIIPAVLFCFAVQFLTLWVMPLISTNFTKLSQEDQRSFGIRVVSIVNGIVMFNSAFFFLDQIRRNNWTIHSRHYEEIEGYRVYRLLIVGYFLWDILVCVGYRWGMMWTVHAIASFLGTYFLAFPFSEQYATYFSGMFETSNAFLHIAVLLKMLGVHLQLAAVLEYIFALLFFVIRVIGGTYITASWYSEMVPLILAGKAHSNTTISICLTLVLVVMLLQYFWFWEIVKIALGLDAKPPQAATVVTSSEANGVQGKKSGVVEPTSPNRKRRPAEKIE